MIVVSNAGPLIALARIGHLPLLHSLYGELLIPSAVQAEVTCARPDSPGAREVDLAEWITVVSVSDQLALSFLRERLDLGESEAIILALEQEAKLLLIDEARGRRIAQTKGLANIGTVGILILAKRRGLVDLVTPLLEKLISSGFHMDEALFQKARNLAAET